MNDNRFRKRVLAAACLSAKGKTSRAFTLFNKLRAGTDDAGLMAFLDFHEGLCEAERGNHESAALLLSRCSDYFETAGETSQACTACTALGKSLSAAGRHDDAVYAFLRAEKLTENPALLCEIKTLCAEARMASDTVYDTGLFIEPCKYMRQLVKNGEDIDTDYFIRACLIAAQACSAINLDVETAEFCLLGIEFALANPDCSTLPQALECSELLCRSAVHTWNKGLIHDSAEKAYSFVCLHPFNNDKSHWISLLHTLSLLEQSDTAKANAVLESLIGQKLSSQNELFFIYCSCLSSKCDFLKVSQLSEQIPTGNIDELYVFAESIIDRGFSVIAADIYSLALDIYPDNRPLIVRPYASLLYRLGNYSESAKLYSELTPKSTDAVLNRAHSLASIRSGDSETAKEQMLAYIENSEDKEVSLTIASTLAMDEGFPPEFCASLYSRLALLLEKKECSGDDIVDAYNRLGICLYRSQAPIEAEISAFKKAASHAETCEAARNTNLHAVIICNLAECYMRQGDSDLCYDTFKKADEIFSGIDDLDLMQYSTCLKFMSDILILRGDKEGSAEILKKAVELLEPHADDNPSIARQLSLCRNALGTVYFKLGKPELEIPELTKAIEIVSKYPVDDASLALLYSNRGEAYERLGKYDCMAEDYAISLELGKEYAQSNPDDAEGQISRASKWLSIGRYREDSMEHSTAISAYKTALDILDALPDTNSFDTDELTAFAYYQLGNAYCHQNVKDFSSSLAAYSRSLSILESLPSSPSIKMHLASTYDARAAFYEVFGEHALAVSDYRKAQELRDSVEEDSI